MRPLSTGSRQSNKGVKPRRKPRTVGDNTSNKLTDSVRFNCNSSSILNPLDYHRLYFASIIQGVELYNTREPLAWTIVWIASVLHVYAFHFTVWLVFCDEWNRLPGWVANGESVTKFKLLGLRNHSFSFSAPTEWNSFPKDLHDSSISLLKFKSMLKTHLFRS